MHLSHAAFLRRHPPRSASIPLTLGVSPPEGLESTEGVPVRRRCSPGKNQKARSGGSNRSRRAFVPDWLSEGSLPISCGESPFPACDIRSCSPPLRLTPPQSLLLSAPRQGKFFSRSGSGCVSCWKGVFFWGGGVGKREDRSPQEWALLPARPFLARTMNGTSKCRGCLPPNTKCLGRPTGGGRSVPRLQESQKHWVGHGEKQEAFMRWSLRLTQRKLRLGCYQLTHHCLPPVRIRHGAQRAHRQGFPPNLIARQGSLLDHVMQERARARATEHAQSAFLTAVELRPLSWGGTQEIAGGRAPWEPATVLAGPLLPRLPLECSRPFLAPPFPRPLSFRVPLAASELTLSGDPFPLPPAARICLGWGERVLFSPSASSVLQLLRSALYWA